MKIKEEDKIKHILWSFWLTAVALIFLSEPVSLFLVFLIGFFKEVWDRYYGSGFCLYDLFGNMIGILMAFMTYVVLIWSFALT
ncbi:hypothetical protein [Rhodoferax sp.]|uniref:hypothetical protein n=1 Tax=Rhodoferax sp. TaxID=50421 RepID=UPI002615929E|nr:hypothetical protein [Rhodoferax sp.]MDD5478447.1 hypothetical protein [Rhodoferax sp.]